MTARIKSYGMSGFGFALHAERRRSGMSSLIIALAIIGGVTIFILLFVFVVSAHELVERVDYLEQSVNELNKGMDARRAEIEVLRNAKTSS
jgi:uncharacterized membrane protein